MFIKNSRKQTRIHLVKFWANIHKGIGLHKWNFILLIFFHVCGITQKITMADTPTGSHQPSQFRPRSPIFVNAGVAYL